MFSAKFTGLCSFMVQPYSPSSRQIDRQITSALIILKLSYFGKKQFVKNGSFTDFWCVGSRN